MLQSSKTGKLIYGFRCQDAVWIWRKRGSQGTREDLLGAGNIFDLDSDVGNRGRFIIKCIKLWTKSWAVFYMIYLNSIKVYSKIFNE